ncbi:MAG: polysaccharide deacetylase family protein [Cellvibrio sp.]|uniref:polysaccharide deacetylase family protein n=1 Tax=Cellvibrio sp. TaxID=1965322 RepID=UPI002716FE4C|nr:polysaccharide deacetylase family protein [Cellvibrio sp.]
MKSLIINTCNQLSERGVITALLPEAIPIFMLHRVSNEQDTFGGTPVKFLEQCLAYLRHHRYKVLTLDECHNLLISGEKIPRKVAVFTIDDGFIDHYTNAGSVFSHFKMPLNFFLISDFIDRKLWPWDDQIHVAINDTARQEIRLTLPDKTEFLNLKSKSSTNEITRNLRDLLKSQDQTNLYSWISEYLFPELGLSLGNNIHHNYQPMSWDNAQELHNAGHGVYAHTCTHRILSQLPSAIAAQEIQDSIAKVNEQLGCRQQYFVYPTGRLCDYNDNNKMTLSENGIKMAFNTEPTYATKKMGIYDVPRFSLPNTMPNFIQYLAKFEQAKEQIRKVLFT